MAYAGLLRDRARLCPGVSMMTITLRPAGRLSRIRAEHRANLLALAVWVAQYRRFNDTEERKRSGDRP